MDVSEFDVPFDPRLIAEQPVEPRDHARLMVVERHTGAMLHHQVRDLPGLLDPGDLVVLNDTRVLPVRLRGRKDPGGGEVDVVLVRDLGDHHWQALLKGRLKPGQVIRFSPDCSAVVVRREQDSTVIRLVYPAGLGDLLGSVGHMPLPPYIKRRPTEADRRWYQTVFARSDGSIAAPTAGLHLTSDVLDALGQRGVRLAFITLHIGPGTFLPVRTQTVEAHRLAAEQVEVTAETVESILETKRSGGRVLAVGTTVVRALEGAAASGSLRPYRGETQLFIVPGYHFRVVDRLLTNFHLPRSTLIMLVSAFAGRDRLQEAYGVAVQERYRFYSYGDAMLIR